MLSLWPGLIGFCGKESGVALVISSDEKRVLFVSKDNAPLRWVDIGEFSTDPVAVNSGDDLKKKRPSSES